jgi:hypothetical protein
MGGNTKAIDRETGELVQFFGRDSYADKVDLRKIDRAMLKRSVIDALRTIDELHQRDFGVPIWDSKLRDKLLSSGEAFNGSSEHMFNDKISDEEFKKYKPTVGDIDLTVPAEKLETVFELLKTLEGSEIVPGKFWYIGQNRKTLGGDQINALFAYRAKKKDAPLFLQVDFEAVDYAKGRPDAFAKFGHSSAWEDVKEGVKGVFHKYLLRSLTTSSTLEDAVLLTKGSPLYPPQKVKVAKMTDPVRLLSFSVSSGLRTSVELQKYPDEKGIPPELVGAPVKVGDSFAYKEIPTSSSTYTKNIEEIFTLLFNVEPAPDQLSKLGSFSGVLSLLGDYLTDQEIQNVYEDFVNSKLFGPASQALDLTDSEVDRSVKFSAVAKFRKEFPFLSQPDQSMVQTYYKNYKIRESILRRIKLILST